MNDNQEKSEHGFVKSTSDYPNLDSTPKKHNYFFKGFCIPFISGVVGASLVLGLCMYAPSLKDSDSNDKEKSSQTGIEKIFTSQGAVNTAIDISKYSDTSIAVASKVLPSVVGIEVDFTVYSNFPTFSAATQSSSSKATGSGVIISKDGYILTNNHVIDTSSSASTSYSVSDANKVLVYLYNEDEPIEAKIIGTDSVTDLAVLKIERDNLTAIEFGDSESIQVGEFAMAVGSPLDMRDTVTTGIISGTNREIEDDSGTMYTLIQTDAAINSGNSGGALVNAEGKLIGINTLKLYGTGIEGMGFAIPVNSTFDIAEQLISYGKVKRPYIGISGTDITETMSAYYKLPVGIYIRRIESDGPAKSSDLKLADVIIKFNGTDVKTMSDLNELKNKCKIGDEVRLTVSRNGEELDVDIVLAEQP